MTLPPWTPPAFPYQPRDAKGNPYAPTERGALLLDYFASAAMQGWMATHSPHEKHPEDTRSCDVIALNSYAMALAMIKERTRLGF